MSCPEVAEIGLRCFAIGIACYDYLLTIPAAYRLFAQTNFLRPSRASILFFSVRYLSITALITSSVGFFSTGFTLQQCEVYFTVAPAFKVLASIASSIIVALRTYALSGKVRWVKYLLYFAVVSVSALQLFSNFYNRTLSQTNGNCSSGNGHGSGFIWLHYLAAIVLDLLALVISTAYLLRHSPGLFQREGFSRLMFEQGLLYFASLTIVNVVNLILFRTDNVQLQPSATPLGEVVTWIMSQRLIISLNNHYSHALLNSASHALNSLPNPYPSVRNHARKVSIPLSPPGAVGTNLLAQAFTRPFDHDAKPRRPIGLDSDIESNNMHVQIEVEEDFKVECVFENEQGKTIKSSRQTDMLDELEAMDRSPRSDGDFEDGGSEIRRPPRVWETRLGRR